MREAAARRFAKPEVQEKLRQARLRQTFPLTDIEIILCDEFKRRHLEFIMHLSMWGRWVPDFAFEGALLIVQADGYFHSWPKIAARDALFNERAAAEGWTVLHFSSKEIKASAAACGRAVAAFVRKHQTPPSVPPAPSQS
jgi:very-short-patch-repair endonuclease